MRCILIKILTLVIATTLTINGANIYLKHGPEDLIEYVISLGIGLSVLLIAAIVIATGLESEKQIEEERNKKIKELDEKYQQSVVDLLKLK